LLNLHVTAFQVHTTCTPILVTRSY